MVEITSDNRPAKKYRPPAAASRLISPKLERAVNQSTIRSSIIRAIVSFAILPLITRLRLKINYDEDNFWVEVPHSRLNRNSYGTIGGAALLANLELAAGCYLFMKTNGGHRIVCRNVSYRFMLPSDNGLHFRIEPMDDNLDAAIAANEPFNAEVKVIVYSRGERRGQKGRRIGRGEMQFHLWPI